ncbi:DMT family transporter [Aminobacterium mobile]|uniref:DMT family transporter n=1 Tax=Aminobacterium mobile TaxID=81467 RepID=UPI00046414CB|nr:DMT family transporter [Aminobacterium mobile]
MSLLTRYKVLFADSALVLIALFWGVGFVAMKGALDSFPPFYLLSVRFTASFFILALLFRKRLETLTIKQIRSGLLVGVFLFLGFVTQTIGLEYTTAGKQAFITSTYVVMVPFLSWAIRKIFPGTLTFVSSFICLVGMGLLSLQGDGEALLNLNRGDLLTIACAFFFACHILAIEYFAASIDPLALTALQIGTTAVLSIFCALFFETWPVAVAPSAWGDIAFTVLLCTVFALSVQNAAQQFTPSSHAAILLSLESVFGALAGILLLNETFTAHMTAGCVLIFIAVLLTEAAPLIFQRFIAASGKETAKS